jgi:hypothetical protein
MRNINRHYILMYIQMDISALLSLVCPPLFLVANADLQVVIGLLVCYFTWTAEEADEKY